MIPDSNLPFGYKNNPNCSLGVLGSPLGENRSDLHKVSSPSMSLSSFELNIVAFPWPNSASVSILFPRHWHVMAKTSAQIVHLDTRSSLNDVSDNGNRFTRVTQAVTWRLTPRQSGASCLPTVTREKRRVLILLMPFAQSPLMWILHNQWPPFLMRPMNYALDRSCDEKTRVMNLGWW